jgi:hypothetical protein
MQLLAIDPGTTESAWVWLDEDGSLVAFKKESNETFLTFLRGNSTLPRQCVIEMVASYGMPVGREVFETVLWAGRFAEAHKNAGFLYRQDVKLNLCKSTKANDASIRQALIDRFGPGKEKALGTKKAPGPLYGVTKDVWAALALAVTWNDTRAQRAG